VKSGWACAVVVSGSARSPRVVDSRRVELSDPAVPESRQPYHAGFGSARSSGPKLSRLVASVQRFGHQSVTDLIALHRADGTHCSAAGVVVGSLIDPESIGNAHIRIHALEGQLFRQVVLDGATGSGLTCSIWRERDLYSVAAAALKQSEEELREALTALGRTVGGTWRSEQKAASLAAWLVLAGAGLGS
jgi:hypothetical protein